MSRQEPTLAAAIVNDGIVALVCTAMCWPCMFDEHHEPAEWHTYADDEDIAHAASHGYPDPSSVRCGCWCAEVAK